MPKFLLEQHSQLMFAVEAETIEEAIVKFHTTDTWSRRENGITELVSEFGRALPMSAGYGVELRSEARPLTLPEKPENDESEDEGGDATE